MSTTVLFTLGPDGTPVGVDPTTPLVRADDHAVLRGEAIFETLRTYGGHAFQLPEHLARLRISAARINLAVPGSTTLRRLVETAATAFASVEGQLRLVVTPGPRRPDGSPPGQVGPQGPGVSGGVAFALVTEVPPGYEAARARGIAAVTLALGVPATLRPSAPWLLGGVKATSYAVAMAALRVAAEAGAADAIWVSSDGEVLEAPTSTVVMVVDGDLVTPPAAEVGILPGTTVRAVEALAGGIVERRITVAELRAARELMLLSSVRGVAPLVTLDGAPIGDGAVGPVTAGLRDSLEEAVRSGQEL
ncbi:MAG: aminotransferase class IV [Frankia sp.]